MTAPRARRLLATLTLSFAMASSAASQTPEPKAVFTNALGEFSLGLKGEFGDEGARLRATIDTMRRAIDAWDAEITGYEAAMDRDRRGASAETTVRLHVALGAVYLDRGRAADALREFTAASALDASRADILTFQALARSQLAKEPAIDDFRKGAALAPGDPIRAYQFGHSLLSAGRTDEGVKEMERFLGLRKLPTADSQLPTSNSAPFLQVGLVAESPGVEPFFPPVRYAKGFALIDAGDYAGAVRQFAEAIVTDPLAAPPGADAGAVARAAAALRDGGVQTAIQQLTLATTLEPDRPEPHRLLGQAYLLDDQHEKAVPELTKAIALAPADERARLALGTALVTMNQLPAAARHFTEMLEALPGSGQAQYELGLVHQRNGKYPEALDAFERSLRFRPLLGANSVYQTIGALRRTQQNFDGAAAAFAKRSELIPNDAGAHQELGDVYFRQGRHTEALAEFAIVLMLNPMRVDAHAAIAQIHLRDGRYTEAVEAATQVLGLDPEHREARYALATSLIRLGRTDAGKRELDIFQRQQAEDAAARTRLFELEGLKREAAVSAAGGDHEKAIALLRKVVDADPMVPGSLLDLGFALIDGARHADAIPYLLKAVELGAHYEVHRHLAAAYAVVGQTDESREERALYEQLKRDDLRHAGVSR